MSMRAVRCSVGALALFLILLSAAYYCLLIDNRMPAGKFDLDTAAVRHAAARFLGASPTAI